MQLEIKLGNPHITVSILAVSIILILSAVLAYQSGGPPSTMGHSVDELALGPLHIDTINSRVGIGTTTPSTDLHVVGNVLATSIQATSIQATGLVSCDTIDTDAAGNLACGADDPGPPSPWTESGGNVYRQTGNIGIGTAQPATSLHVVGNARVTGLASCSAIQTDASGNLACGNPSLWADQGSYINPNNYNQLAITDTGRLGVGTTTPSETLHVVGNIFATGTICNATACMAGGGPIFGDWVDLSSSFSWDTPYGPVETDGFITLWADGGHAGDGAIGYTDSSTDPTTKVTGEGAGFVDYSHGIIMPVKKGHYWKVGRTSVYYGSVDLKVRWLPIISGGVGGSDSDWTISGNDMFSGVTGNVGIGTPSPTQKLDVTGNVRGQQLCIGNDCRSSWPVATDTRCDSSGTCSQVCIGSACRSSWGATICTWDGTTYSTGAFCNPMTSCSTAGGNTAIECMSDGSWQSHSWGYPCPDWC